ncbi:MAG: bifunctional riboflavin kinase/FAD synthetase [Candidatus Omnitrophota bacterium]|nr:bifunctional riboflavin kinase/FAD synthetase [Candidatus Omnitrophota bacterium]
MKVIYKNLPASKKECIAAIGVFDGVHLGHQYILNKLIQESEEEGRQSLLITFDIPPKMILNKTFPGCITSSEDKKSIIKSMGVDYLWFLKTHSSFLKQSGKEFIGYILENFKIKKFIVGSDFRFGYKGETDVKRFRQYGDEYGFKVDALKKISWHNQIVSSTLIRKLIKTGEFKEAEKFLGRKYVLTGSVHRGMRYGQKLGFPTANIDPFDYVVPSNGVYVAVVGVDKKNYLSAVNIGVRPTIRNSQKRVIEAHMLDFNKDILGKTITVVFLEKIREEKKFSRAEKLKEAIAWDVYCIKEKFRHVSWNV